MKKDQEQSGNALMPSASRGLIGNSSELARRGVKDLKLSAERDASELDANDRNLTLKRARFDCVNE